MHTYNPLAWILAIALVATATVHAQSHPERMIVGGGFPAASNDPAHVPGIYLVRPTFGSLVTFNDYSVTSVYYMRGISNDFDNQSLVFGTGYNASTTSMMIQSGLYRYSPLTGSYRTLIYDPVNLSRVNGSSATQTGRWHIVATNQTQSTSGIYEVDPQGFYSTIRTISGNVFNLAIARDVDSGNTIVPQRSSGVIQVTHNGTTSSFISGIVPVGRDLDQRIADGGFYFTQNQGLYRFGRNSPLQQVATLPRAATGISFDNQSRQNAPLYVYSVNGSPLGADVFELDPGNGFTVTKTTPVTPVGPGAKVPWGGGQALHYQTRYIQTALVGPRQYQLLLSFPTFANKSYAVAMTVSGIRPGFKVPGQRQVWLNPDALTTLSLSGGLAPAFNPGPLVLSATGRAFGSINLRPVAAVPVVIHLVAVVIDPAAPGGLAFITEPYPLRLD